MSSCYSIVKQELHLLYRITLSIKSYFRPHTFIEPAKVIINIYPPVIC